jgi:hypothetical protein
MVVTKVTGGVTAHLEQPKQKETPLQGTVGA